MLPSLDAHKQKLAIASRRKLTYARLGINTNLLRTLPPISSQLRLISRRLRKRNLPASPYYYLKCVPGDHAREIVELYYSFPKKDRDLIPIEAYCLAAGADPALILEQIVHAVAKLARHSSAILAAASHPLVVDKTIEMALTDEGIEDRNTIHKAVGFLPTPKGSQTTVNVAANANANASPQIAIAPPPEQTIRRAVDRFNVAKTITQAPQAALPQATTDVMIPSNPIYERELIEAEVDADEDE